MNYWQSRTLKAQERLTERSIAETEKQLAKYYERTAKNMRGRFLLVYSSVLSSLDEGMAPTPADLFKLDKYWKLQAAMKQELQDLGQKEISLYYQKFMEQWRGVYDSFAMKTDAHFNAYDDSMVKQMIERVWCADGKSWSERVWTNTSKLQQALNDGLLDSLLTGANPNQLKEKLMRQFEVSYNRADTLVRTEMAHIQSQAAQQRYKDAGIEWVQVYASKDERRCEICGVLHMQRFRINDYIPVPAHPKCRCTIIPVIEESSAYEMPDHYYSGK